MKAIAPTPATAPIEDAEDQPPAQVAPVLHVRNDGVQVTARRCQRPGCPAHQPNAQACWGSSPAASAKAVSAVTVELHSVHGTRPTMAVISCLRSIRDLVDSQRPRGEREIVVSRRLPRAIARRTSFLATNRSHSRVAVDGWIESSSASSPTSRGPPAARTTNARYCGKVTSASTARRATGQRRPPTPRTATRTASVTSWMSSSTTVVSLQLLS